MFNQANNIIAWDDFKFLNYFTYNSIFVKSFFNEGMTYVGAADISHLPELSLQLQENFRREATQIFAALSCRDLLIHPRRG